MKIVVEGLSVIIDGECGENGEIGKLKYSALPHGRLLEIRTYPGAPWWKRILQAINFIRTGYALVEVKNWYIGCE